MASSEETPLIPPGTDAVELSESMELRLYKQSRSVAAWKRFCAFAFFGLLFILGFNLVFLPRTSLSRDLRRIHGDRLTAFDVQKTFLETLEQENNAREILKRYTSENHIVGEGYGLVEYTKAKFEEYGIKTHVETFYVWLNRPVANHLKLLDSDGNLEYQASLKEDVLEEDETTGDKNSVPAFHAYSANGNVTAKFVYAHFGRVEDFKALKEADVSLEGKIVIMRYGAIVRGLKVKLAQRYGAVGVVLYTDPYDDGEIRVKNGYKAYPDGPARNPSSIERGSVIYFSDIPGDPTTPGWGSTKNAKRVSPQDSMPKIPSLPCSYNDIKPILAKLNGKGPNLGWAGDVDEFDYCAGTSDVDLNLYNEQDYQIRPIYNVMGEIKGIMPDEEIIVGNHRDAFIVGGAGDPNSGSVALIETARGLGALLKKGWKPLRTIKLASWDGEEYGMLGSTEYGEKYARHLQDHTLAYINLDVGVAGSAFAFKSNPMFMELGHKVAKEIPFRNKVDSGYSLFDYWSEQNNATVNTLGAGTDYVVFQEHLGIPSMTMEFREDGVTDPVYHYHSNFDSFHWMDKFCDPTWELHSTMAQFFGLLLISVTEQEVSVLDVKTYAEQISKYYYDMIATIPKSWVDYLLLFDAEDGQTPAYMKNTIKQLQMAHGAPRLKDLMALVESNIKGLIEHATIYQSYKEDLQDKITEDYPWFRLFHKVKIAVQIKVANLKLLKLDRLLLFKDGLKNRVWMKHVIIAPSREKGYDGDILPGLHEAQIDGDFDEFVRWLVIIGDKIKLVGDKLK
ncbi:unnamed protein product [Kuraishia capsulata CBS 1993]|uniref:Uncharacterized protein n=1 Tax=Kuraishia capsulata CBS 1993 TaxID=1382522 RepID=W6MSX9_9ASCO|nr:uncharacterized protein KUCA_T00004314001 [Kuraishia capsulata CBS 1993]CDK28332.1 unnamed protein product [Kuraishia capsulata CBS 1993]